MCGKGEHLKKQNIEKGLCVEIERAIKMMRGQILVFVIIILQALFLSGSIAFS